MKCKLLRSAGSRGRGYREFGWSRRVGRFERTVAVRGNRKNRKWRVNRLSAEISDGETCDRLRQALRVATYFMEHGRQ